MKRKWCTCFVKLVSYWRGGWWGTEPYFFPILHCFWVAQDYTDDCTACCAGWPCGAEIRPLSKMALYIVLNIFFSNFLVFSDPKLVKILWRYGLLKVNPFYLFLLPFLKKLGQWKKHEGLNKKLDGTSRWRSVTMKKKHGFFFSKNWLLPYKW